MIWDSSPEEIEEWLDRVMNRKPTDTSELIILDREIE